MKREKGDAKNKRVEEALLKLALGHVLEEERETIEEDASGKLKKKTERIRKEIAPDMRAVLEWLRNQSPDTWGEVGGQSPVIQLISSIPRPDSDSFGHVEVPDNEDCN